MSFTTSIVSAALSAASWGMQVYNSVFGRKNKDDMVNAKVLNEKKEKQDEFAKLVARAKNGDLEAQEEIRRRRASHG